MTARQGRRRRLKTVGCLSFLLILAALLVIDRYSPATGYELSIYDSLAPAVWICLLAALGGGTAIIVHQAFSGASGGFWLVGLGLILLSVCIILCLPLIKGYFLYGADDAVVHTRYAELILTDHHFHSDNRYPVTHILMAQLAQVSGAKAQSIGVLVPVFFTILFMLSSYLLASAVMPNKASASVTAASATLFFNYYHVALYPQSLSIMSLPLVFYLYFRSSGSHSLGFRVALVFVLFLFPFFHPAPAGVLIACLLAAEAAKALWRARGKLTGWSHSSSVTERITFVPTLICSVAFLTWISSFEIFGTTIRRTLGWLTGEIESVPQVKALERAFQGLGLGIQDQVVLALKMYGDNLICLSLTGIALLLIAWGFARRRPEISRLSVLSMPFLVSGPVWVLIFATTLRVTVGRLLGSNAMMWAVPVFTAFGLYEVFGRWNKAGVVAATSILFVATVVGVLGVYHSPYILQPGWHVTRQQVQGTAWFLAHTEFQKRDVFATMGILPAMASGLVGIPDHFGYPFNDRLGSWYPRDVSLLIGEPAIASSAHPVLSRAMVSDRRLARPGFHLSDFERLGRDPSVGKAYENGELDVFLIRGEM